MALTAPTFALGALAGNSTASDHVQWSDVVYLLIPALIALIQAIADRIRSGPRTKGKPKHAAP